MFRPELWQSHDEYRTLVTSVGRRLSRNNSKYSFDLYKQEQDKLLSLDLIPTYYSDGSRPAEHQAQIFRSLVLFVLLFNKTKPCAVPRMTLLLIKKDIPCAEPDMKCVPGAMTP